MAGRLKRRAALAALAFALTLLHLSLADRVLEASIGWGDAPERVRRIEVAFVQDLKPTAPPAAAPAPTPRPRARAPAAALLPPEPAASSPPPPPLPLPPPPPEPAVVAQAPEPEPASAPEAASAPETAAPAASAASSPTPGFEWPPSTRLSYTLSGNYRGPVEGEARVEWVKTGERYQVRLDVAVGAPLTILSRRITSEGTVGADGLEPRRYEEETKVAFRDPRRLAIEFDADRVRLPGGKEAARPPGVQDTASQFVQLTWLFSTRPSLLQPGQSIALPLALPRYVDTWTYDVKERETLATPFGAIDTVHVKPRREPRPGVDLTAELWVAPTLQYLPVRIVIRQDAETYVDLLVRQLPQQAAR